MHNVVSDSRASDASYRALADAAHAAAELESWLIVGGHMVNLHVLRSGMGLPLRATRDADLGVELLAIRATALLERLRALGYDNTQHSNRFDRRMHGSTASIDLLAPSYSNRHKPNMDAGDIAIDGLPVLHAALAREPVAVDLSVGLSDGGRIQTTIQIPDVVSAIALKTFAYVERFAARDAEDLHRLLEVAFKEGVDASKWPAQSSFVTAGRELSILFDSPGRALRQATTSLQAQTRLRAITRSLVGRVQ